MPREYLAYLLILGVALALAAFFVRARYTSRDRKIDRAKARDDARYRQRMEDRSKDADEQD